MTTHRSMKNGTAFYSATLAPSKLAPTKVKSFYSYGREDTQKQRQLQLTTSHGWWETTQTST